MSKAGARVPKIEGMFKMVNGSEMVDCDICGRPFRRCGIWSHKWRAHGIHRPGTKSQRYLADLKNNPEMRERKRLYARLYRQNNKVKLARKEAIWGKRVRAKLRTRMFEIYGDKCACCGESNKEFLTLDHVQNDGGRERGRSGKYRLSDYMRKAVKFPDKNRFQILCYNCNLGRAKNKGICPHKQWQVPVGARPQASQEVISR